MIYTNHRSIPVQDGLSVDSAILLTEMVGVEPTRPCGPIAFRVRPLQPLEYISIQSLLNSLILLQCDRNSKIEFKNYDEKAVKKPPE